MIFESVFKGVLLTLCSAGCIVAEPDSDSNKRVVQKLVVFPMQIELSNARDQQSIIAQLHYSDGITQDVSDEIAIEIVDPEIVSFSTGQFLGRSNGATQAAIRMNEFEVVVSIKVQKSELNPPVSFLNEVVPILSKVGCNAGSCHGAARGKDGFQLSLYGYDPSGDYFRLTREMPGRRINLGMPEECLLVSKATGEVAHSGGALIQRGSKFHQSMLRWLREGALNDSTKAPQVERVFIYPESSVLNGEGAVQQLSVVATYSDGTDSDVTSLAYFLSNNDNAVTVDASGLVTAHRRGEAFVTARFDSHTVGVPFVVVPRDEPFDSRTVSEKNYIDSHIHSKLRKLRLRPSELCNDQEFIRRVSIDICGVVPTEQEVLEFCDDQSVDKRSSLIDRLLERKEFVDIWVMKWSELLQIRSLNNIVSYKAALLYYAWLQDQISNDVPIDQMIKELLASKGGTFTSPATNYYQNEQDNLKVAENVAQVFMGIRIQCAQCHNHPFDRWTMDDYYSFAAFFSQIGRKRAEDPRETIVYNRGRGETKHPVNGKNMPPKFLGGEFPKTKGKDRRAVLAEWLASDQNPFFAKNLSNIIWAHFFGRGIVHEVDDIRISNPAVNQPLLDELANRLTEYGYDFKKLVRDICNSNTYQRSTKANETNHSDTTNFSHASLRRIRAEVLLDVISQITETQNKFRGLPLGSRAVQIADG
ncbi:MAG: DUF1549 domain-containing protein, partial [Planctomycetota bacterium]